MHKNTRVYADLPRQHVLFQCSKILRCKRKLHLICQTIQLEDVRNNQVFLKKRRFQTTNLISYMNTKFKQIYHEKIYLLLSNHIRDLKFENGTTISIF